jgi:hypothetical protein
MTNRRTYLAGAAVCVSALVAVGTPAVSAAAATTAVTFTLTSGYLTVAQGGGTVAFDAASGLSADQLGPVVVHDSRGGTLGWTASGTSTVVAAPGVAMTVAYSSGPVITTGRVTAASQGETGLTATPAALVIGTGVTGNNTASWRPTVTVTRAPDAAAHSYTATVTHSVL